MKEIRTRFQGGLVEVKEFKTAMTSLEVAEITGKEHKTIMRDIRLEVSEIGEELGKNIFVPSSYISLQNKELPMYNLSEMGCRQMGMRWSAKDRFTINVALDNKSKPVSQLDLIIQSAEVLKLVTDRIENLEDKFDSVVTLESGKQRKLQKNIACRVMNRLVVLASKKELPSAQKPMLFKDRIEEDKKFKSKLFSAIHRELKNKFGVSSYKDIKVAEYETALHWIQNWIENSDIREYL